MYLSTLFYAAKRVRSETAVGSHAVSMGYAVAQLALQVLVNLKTNGYGGCCWRNEQPCCQAFS